MLLIRMRGATRITNAVRRVGDGVGDHNDGDNDDDDDGQQGSPILWEWLYGNRQGRWHFHRVTGKGMGLPLYYDDDGDGDGVEEIGSKIPWY